jgi:catalase
MLKLVAPMVGGIEASDGSWLEADEKIDGGPSVLFDAVALIPSRDGAALLAREASARDFVSDAFAHLKFIAYVAAAEPLLEKAGVLADLDEGCVKLSAADDAKAFVAACRKLRFWQREAAVKQV